MKITMNPKDTLTIESTGKYPTKAIIEVAHDGQIMRRTDSGSCSIKK